MSSLKARQTEALPPVGIGPESRDFYIQDSSAAGAKDQEKKSLDARVATLEKAAKKSSDAEKKKKAADAEKPLVKVGGKIHADMGWFSQDANNVATVGDIQDGVDFRRARIAVSGTILDVTNYKIEMDFAASGRPSFRDVYLGVSDLPYVNNVRVGHYKEWFGLEQLTSDDYITFIERRSLPDAFAPARNWGLSTFDHFEGECGTWAIGAFRTDTDEFGDDIGDSGEWSATGRITALPWYDEPSEGRYFLHLGAAASYRDPDSLNPLLGNGAARFSSRPEAFIAETGVGSVPNFVDTGSILANDFQLFGTEARIGLWTAQSAGRVDGDECRFDCRRRSVL